MHMNDYVLVTDTCCDLPASMVASCGLTLLPLAYEIDGTLYDGVTRPYQNAPEFYQLMRSGNQPKTFPVEKEAAAACFSSFLEQGLDVLCVSVSGGLSGNFALLSQVAAELNQRHLEQRVVVVDSLSVSLGQGLLLYLAGQKKKEGMDLDSLVQWITDHRQHLCHPFTVEDLTPLCAGGRFAKTAPVLSSMLNIKPLLVLNEEGHLTVQSKVRGRKAALDALVSSMGASLTGFTNSICFISHGDCPQDAEYVADAVRRKFGISEFLISEIGPICGAHAGPGTVALFFLGDKR